MAPTWREERPDAITAASHSAERPSRLMVTIFSALSSSSEMRMRLSRSVCVAAFGAEVAAAGFLGSGFLKALEVGAAFFAGFFAGILFVAFGLAAGFLTALAADFGAAFAAGFLTTLRAALGAAFATGFGATFAAGFLTAFGAAAVFLPALGAALRVRAQVLCD
jgi:hypothetical protein